MFRKSNVIIFSIILFFCLILHGTDWYEDYLAGLKKIEKSDWGEAAEYFKKALEKNPDSQLKARTYGINFIDYFPYFYLGLANYNLNNMEEAVKNFSKELEYDFIKKKPDLYSRLTEMLNSANSHKFVTVKEQIIAKIKQLTKDWEYSESINYLTSIINNLDISGEYQFRAWLYYALAKIYFVIGDDNNCDRQIKNIYLVFPSFNFQFDQNPGFTERIEKLQKGIH